ncbi:MAG: chromosome segregation protein SMC [Coprococcus sp.]|uniref:chromosome segregation protein SMC n=1 Tax=Coprococcus catus TaxID=116085 RepID=UPI001C00BF45|nr:chromosome segregation protein SMC [Coprococcus catus]MBT9771767.1 chromosome segregation protein SMC [Coprococcus catus]
MFLKSIEVQGFKSFANKMVFEFHKGITGIVGPNGSGKSNVADAVRWVLGEQSAKQLRGSRMEDVIFSGTESRKPLGFAYVAITLDNSDHQLAVEYDTVTVSRRVYRSGESEYKINGHNCRLKDVQELFFDTGIGKEGYSIIGQGQIDKILSGKPEERRELFDEAAGIVKYKRRKALTEKNLAEEQQNLSRVRDILYELEKQVGPLAKQSETARIYLKHRDTLKQYDANMYLMSFYQLKKDSADIDDKIDIVSAQLKDFQENFEKIKSAYAEMEALMEQYDQKIAENQEVCNQQALEKQRLEGTRNVFVSKLEGIAGKEEQFDMLIEDAQKSLGEKQQLLEDNKKELETLEEELKHLEQHKNSSEEELHAMSGMVTSLRERIDSQNSDIIEFLNETANIKGRMQRYETMQEQTQIRQSELDQKLIALQSEESSEGELVEAFKKEAQGVAIELERIQAEQAACKKRAAKISDDLMKCRDAFNAAEKSFHEESARYQTLKNITERYDGYGVSIRKIMERKNDYKGIIGVVADIIHVSKEYEIAIETALGGSISNIVTDDEQTAKNMIRFLKTNRFGRATFLPLTSIRGRRADNADRICSEAGVIGLASDLIKVERQFDNLADYLLGRVFIVDHIDNALALAKKYRYSLRIVTLEGESLNPGGSLSGGAYKNTGNLLGRHREMEELQKHVESLRKEGASLKQQINQLQSDKESNKAAIEKNTAEESKLTLHQNTVRLRLKQVDESRGEHAKSIQDISRETAQIKAQQEQIRQFKQQLAQQLTELETKKKNAEALTASLTAKLEEISEQERNFNNQTADMRIHYANQVQKKAFIRKSIEQNRSEGQHLQQKLTDYHEQKAAFGKEKTEIREQIEKTDTQIAAVMEKMTESQSILQQKTDERSQYAVEHKSFFAKREELSETISRLDREQFRLGSQKEKLEENRSQLSSYMWEEYGLTYQTARELSDDELQTLPLSKLKKMASDIKGEIKALGNVNVNAIEEYKAVAERYETMKTQHDDMVEAEGKLASIIEDLNISMQKQFQEKFMQIRKEFDRIFKLLFGGGKGTLELADPENLLETGVIITAQPPGKKLQNMMQLSGGEKALTAIALLFAIQSLKPSPFCLLDEIEAALDDANVKRFAEYLHNLTKDTQFIVITHRRGTMNTADVLYGITMQEKGVSTLVSVNLIENELGK